MRWEDRYINQFFGGDVIIGIRGSSKMMVSTVTEERRWPRFTSICTIRWQMKQQVASFESIEVSFVVECFTVKMLCFNFAIAYI